MDNRRKAGKITALGGMLAALALVIMGLGTVIPVATYVCPVACMLLLRVMLRAGGTRMAWAWYGAVAALSLLLAPDKEAAAVFVFLGYYPIIKPWLDQRRGALVWKLLVFNGATLSLYWILIRLVGMEELIQELEGMKYGMTAVLLILGNITFFLLDRLLEKY